MTTALDIPDEILLSAVDWTALNQERAALIHRKVSRGLNAEEDQRLEYLQRLMREYVDRIAPLPASLPTSAR